MSLDVFVGPGYKVPMSKHDAGGGARVGRHRGLDPAKKARVLDACRIASTIFEGVTSSLLPWALAHGGPQDRLGDAVSRLGDSAAKMPGNWAALVATQIAIASVLCDTRRIGEFLADEGPRLGGPAARLVQSWQAEPASFTAFTIDAPLGDDLFRVRDVSDDRTLLLESPALGEISRNPARLYLSLLFPNGECLQAAGPMHYYRAIGAADLHWYAGCVDPAAFASEGLPAVINRRPEMFAVLDYWSEIPSMAFRGVPMVSCTTTLDGVTLDTASLSSGFDLEEASGTVRFRLKGSAPPLGAADLYWKPSTGQAFLYASSLEGYRRLAGALAGTLEVPPEPAEAVSQAMEVIAMGLLDIKPAVTAWERPFEPPPPSPAAEAELRKVNLLLRDVSDAMNHGRPYDLAALARRRGVSLETARGAEGAILRSFEGSAIDVPGGLPGVPVPPPSEREKYRQPLDSCAVFRFTVDEAAQGHFSAVRGEIERLRPGATLSRTRTLLALPTLPRVLEEIDDWEDDPTHLVLKHTLYLLCHAGTACHGTGDYAAEVLRLFWQVVPGSDERPALRRFVRQYAIWCRELLVRAGLVEADPSDAAGPAAKPGASFAVRTTPFFRAWIGLRQKTR